MLNIEYREYAGEEFGSIIGLEFTKYAEKNNVASNYLPFCFVAKNDDEFAGIITGHSYYKEVKISDLIVIEQFRGKQVGKKLVETVEAYFQERGYENINLSTYEFQAPDFYKKCGYQIEFIRENKSNPKLTKYFFIKYF
jgi:ribosomal protein S18 acetylase RimI-like enzyme